MGAEPRPTRVGIQRAVILRSEQLWKSDGYRRQGNADETAGAVRSVWVTEAPNGGVFRRRQEPLHLMRKHF
ncbi:MAG TPA: hypothetical protein DCE44_14070 [Verrucomicrobiales bacterium]|nr:hypothetical protein [Verrucomicrobiales bacterium]